MVESRNRQDLTIQKIGYKHSLKLQLFSEINNLKDNLEYSINKSSDIAS